MEPVIVCLVVYSIKHPLLEDCSKWRFCSFVNGESVFIALLNVACVGKKDKVDEAFQTRCIILMLHGGADILISTYPGSMMLAHVFAI